MRIVKPKPELAPSIQPTVGDIRQAAGFFEGDGTVSITTHCDSWGIALSVTQNDRYALEHTMRRFFGGNIHLSNRGWHVWQLYGARARGLAMTFYSLLSPRRKAQIKTALWGAS